jgi:hypothetical protein
MRNSQNCEIWAVAAVCILENGDSPYMNHYEQITDYILGTGLTGLGGETPEQTVGVKMRERKEISFLGGYYSIADADKESIRKHPEIQLVYQMLERKKELKASIENIESSILSVKKLCNELLWIFPTKDIKL